MEQRRRRKKLLEQEYDISLNEDKQEDETSEYSTQYDEQNTDELIKKRKKAMQNYRPRSALGVRG